MTNDQSHVDPTVSGESSTLQTGNSSIGSEAPKSGVNNYVSIPTVQNTTSVVSSQPKETFGRTRKDELDSKRKVRN
jgi:hypothetical protein